MPQQHKNGYRPLHNGTEHLPPSIIKAIDSFVLACAVRRLDGQANEHCSMLVHVTRFNSVQKEVYRQVEEHIRHMRQRLHRNIEHEMILQRLKALWEEDFKPTSQAIRSSQPDQASKGNVTWDDIQAALFDTISHIEIRMINGTAKDALDYDEHKGTGLKVIAIGGDKLARGLTLEALCVSYFLRASRMYDTLMQMGRWFGYRPGYLDLCRLYTTAELSEWFGHIADAAEELREEFDLMVASGATPREYGLTKWTVALIGGGDGGEFSLTKDIAVNMLIRKNNGRSDDRYSIGRLLSPRDEFIDTDAKTWEAALEKTQKAWKPDPARFRDGKLQEPPEVPNGPAIREIRGYSANDIEPSRDRGLLLLCVLEPGHEGANLPESTHLKNSSNFTNASFSMKICSTRRDQSSTPKIQPRWSKLNFQGDKAPHILRAA